MADETKSGLGFEFVVGLCIGLLPWGLSLIGIAVNLELGCLILAVTFGLLAHVFWRWGSARRWSLKARIITIFVAFAFSAGFVFRQVVAQYRLQSVAATPSASPVLAPTPTHAPSPTVVPLVNEPSPARSSAATGRPKKAVPNATRRCSAEDRLLGRC
jgi:hypothetical protein